MGRREFYAWVDQCVRENTRPDDVHDWRVAENDPWWQQARRKREEMLGRG